MTQKNETLLKTYADLKNQAKELNAKIEELEPKVLGFMEKERIDYFKEDGLGTFSVVTRKKWTYSATVVEKEKEYKTIIKQKQIDEQESGEAKFEESKGLSFRGVTE